MTVFKHPIVEAHRLACVDLIRLMNADWHVEPRLDRLARVVNPWNSKRVDEELQALYRPRFSAYFRKLAVRERTQDCPEDYLRGLRAIAMAQKLAIDIFEPREPRGALSDGGRVTSHIPMARKPPRTTIRKIHSKAAMSPRYARSPPPGPERNQHRQIASSLRRLSRNKVWLAGRTVDE